MDGGCVVLGGVAIEACTTGLRLPGTCQVDVDLRDSVISGCGTGILVTGWSSSNAIRNGVVENNTGDGIRVEGCLESPDGNLLEGIQVSNNGGNGIALLDGSGNRVVGCLIKGTPMAVLR
jgi:parallel beta-helix repeat protein